MRGDAQNPKSFRECENISLFGHFIKLYGRYSSLYIDRADCIYPDTQHQASGIAGICARSSRIWRSIRVVYIRPYKIQFLCLISRSCSSKYSEYFLQVISNFATRNNIIISRATRNGA